MSTTRRSPTPPRDRPAPERMGLVCLLKLEEYSTGRVLPHEKTLTAAKADRLELLRATEAQFESIYGLYSDPDGAVQSFLREYDDRETVIERVDGRHRLQSPDGAHRRLRMPTPSCAICWPTSRSLSPTATTATRLR